MRSAKWLIWIALVVSVLWLSASWYVAEQFLSFGIVDYVGEDEQKILDSFGITALEKRAVTIQSEGVSLAASYFPHPNPQDCAVILLPGIGGYRTQVLPALPFFWDIGCHVLTYDPRGTGASDRVQRTFGFYEKRDNAAVVRWIEDQTGLNSSAVGIWGPSFGAAVGILTLDEIEDLGFIIADSTFSSFEEVTHDTIALLTHEIVADVLSPGVIALLELRTGMSSQDVRPEASIVDTSTPVLLIHAQNDPAMHFSHSQRVFDARSTGNVEFKATDWGAGHADSAIIDPVAYRKLILAFLESHGFGGKPRQN